MLEQPLRVVIWKLYGVRELLGWNKLGQAEQLRQEKSQYLERSCRLLLSRISRMRMLLILDIYRAPITVVYYVIDTPVFRGIHEKHDILENLLMEVEWVLVPACFCSQITKEPMRTSAKFSSHFLKTEISVCMFQV